MTNSGGPKNGGVVFTLATAGASSPTYTIIYNCCDAGILPVAPPVADASGVLYGTLIVAGPAPARALTMASTGAVWSTDSTRRAAVAAIPKRYCIIFRAGRMAALLNDEVDARR